MRPAPTVRITSDGARVYVHVAELAAIITPGHARELARGLVLAARRCETEGMVGRPQAPDGGKVDE